MLPDTQSHLPEIFLNSSIYLPLPSLCLTHQMSCVWPPFSSVLSKLLEKIPNFHWIFLLSPSVLLWNKKPISSRSKVCNSSTTPGKPWLLFRKFTSCLWNQKYIFHYPSFLTHIFHCSIPTIFLPVSQCWCHQKRRDASAENVPRIVLPIRGLR